ncbi:Archaeal ATPase [compost metagenome]
MKDFSLQHIDKLFEDYNTDNLTGENCIIEINAMRNTQPPEHPTFFLNQQDAKDQIRSKLKHSLREDAFSCIVLKGVIGDGKTHFLNHIYSHFKRNPNEFFIVKLRVEETERYKRNFIKTVVSEIFAKYYKEFRRAFFQISKSKLPGSLGSNIDDNLDIIRKELDVSDELAKILHKLYANPELEAASIRVLGNSYGKTELKLLEVNELTSQDYLKVIQLFTNFSGEDTLLIIILDEFEHAYGLPLGARNTFFQSFKQFYDMAGPLYKRVSFIAAFTEQYAKGNKKEETIETAMWTRLEANTIELEPFRLTNDNLKQLLNHLIIRYEKAYTYKITPEVFQEIPKLLLRRLEVTHAINYRKAVSNLIKILDDFRENRPYIPPKKPETAGQLELFSLNFENDLVLPPPTQVNQIDHPYSMIISTARQDWDETNAKLKRSKFKSALERVLKEIGFSMTKLTDQPEDITRIEALKDNDYPVIFYISLAKSGGILVGKFDDCLKIKDSLNPEEFLIMPKFCFVYPYESRNKSLIESMKLHPEIIDMGIEESYLYDLLALRLVEDDELEKELLQRVTPLFENIAFNARN